MAVPFPKIVDAAVAIVERWTKPVTIVAGLISLAWGLLLLPVGKRSLYLVTWITSDSVVYPSEVTLNRALPLSYSGAPVQSARMLSVRIQNRGRAPIGSPETLWTLYLTAPAASHLVLLDPPKATPTPLAVQQREANSPQTVALEFGVLDPRATVDLQLLLINSKERGSPLTAKSTLVGLPQEITFSSLSDQLANRYFWPWASPILLLVAVPLLPPLAREWYGRTPVLKRVLWSPAYVFIALVGLFLPAAIWVVVLSHIVAWLY